ncbi:MAG: HD domain-containing protein [Lachnospiraceae bacterium]|nr:HD domain-containing protein [Lachnospiraceae bacterium]
MEFNFYAILLSLSIINLLALIIIGRKQNISVYLMLYIVITINLIGQYTISKSDFLETALVGHRLVYVGAIFTSSLWLLGVAKLCKIKIPKPFIVGLLAYSSFVLYLACNVGTQTLYYTSIALEKHNNYSILVKENGSLHILYPILLIGNVLAIIGMLIYCHIRKENVSKITSILLLVLNVITMTLYFVQKAIDFPYEIYNVAYILVEWIILVLNGRIGMYDISDSIAASIDKNSNYGYIILDKKLRHMSSNLIARKFLPEINNIKIDSALSKDKTPILYAEFARWASEHDKDSKSTIDTDTRHLNCSIKKISNGHLIELIDITHQHKYMKLLNSYNSKLEKEVTAKTERIELLQDKLILGMSDMIESRDSNTGGHVKRTSLAIRIFLEELRKHKDKYKFDEQFFRNVIKAAPMHDLGKIGVDDRILRKPGKFTPEEFEEMKTHSSKGAKIVRQLLEDVEDDDFCEIAINLTHYHHEKWNGQGYPRGLKGPLIPIEARIMALADVFDALVSKRCYKEKMNFDEAFNIIEESLGSHFDPDLGKVFLECRPQLESFYIQMEEEEK